MTVRGANGLEVFSSATGDARVLPGDCRSSLASLPDASVHCCVTSPPYLGLRDYGVDGQLGLESSVGEWVANLVAVFREVRRVLRSDGTLWVNCGDAYATGTNAARGKTSARGSQVPASWAGRCAPTRRTPPGFAAKQLLGLPWRLAFALQDDGWILRSDVVYAKRNPMPESVTDRPARAHEFVFLFARRTRYYYDAYAVRESVASGGGETRNQRDVWTMATEGFRGAHFATFPAALVRPMVLASTSAAGCCPACGAPWRRVVTRTFVQQDGFAVGCTCALAPVPCVVLDPFAGSGTSGEVALALGRRAVLCELNRAYLPLIEERLARGRTERDRRRSEVSGVQYAER